MTNSVGFRPVSAVMFGNETPARRAAREALTNQLGPDYQVASPPNSGNELHVSLRDGQGLSTNTLQVRLTQALLAVPDVSATDREYAFDYRHNGRTYVIKLRGAVREMPRPGV